MSRKIVLNELFDDNNRRIRGLLNEIEPEALHWSPDGAANSIAVTIWHTVRIFDVFLNQHVYGKPADEEIWQTSGWAERTGYDPRGLGTNGWGAVTGYSTEEAAAIPQMDAATVLGYYDEVVGAVRSYLNAATDEELDRPSLGFEGAQPNYFWVRHPLFDLTRHVGEILALRAMWERR